MMIVFLCRKPTPDSIAKTMVTFGTGAINIDATRVNQRWPSNVMFNHHDCLLLGTKRLKSFVLNRFVDGAKPFGGGAGHAFTSHAMDPWEDIPYWNCTPVCPCESLPLEILRYFKTMNNYPQEMLQYFKDMILPPEGSVLHIKLPDQIDQLQALENESLHGVILEGAVESFEEEIWRVLKPGAHIFALPTDEDPTGSTQACLLEDRGFEVRDSIAIIDSPDDFHYVAKATKKERNAGVPLIFAAKLEEEEGDEEDEGGSNGAEPHQNNHPTVKPIDIKRKVIKELHLSKNSWVLDPFLGTGTTGIAASLEDFNFLGIEKEEEYLWIANARVEHWVYQTSWKAPKVSSDSRYKSTSTPVVFDFFMQEVKK